MIDLPTQAVIISSVTNGNCHFYFDITLDSAPAGEGLSDYGLVQFLPVLQQDPATLTYSLVSNGYIEIQSGDETLDGVT